MTANAKNVKRIVLIYANSGMGIGTYKLQHVREPFLQAPLSVASLADPFDSQLACQPYCIDTTYRHNVSTQNADQGRAVSPYLWNACSASVGPC